MIFLPPTPKEPRLHTCAIALTCLFPFVRAVLVQAPGLYLNSPPAIGPNSLESSSFSWGSLNENAPLRLGPLLVALF